VSGASGVGLISFFEINVDGGVNTNTNTNTNININININTNSGGQECPPYTFYQPWTWTFTW